MTLSFQQVVEGVSQPFENGLSEGATVFVPGCSAMQALEDSLLAHVPELMGEDVYRTYSAAYKTALAFGRFSAMWDEHVDWFLGRGVYA